MTSRRWALLALATILVWCGLELALRRSSSITDDWQGWRQADTQAIARNLAFEDFDPLRPRIDWRGDGPGYVETELSLYPALIALVLRAAGRESVWPGQLLSLACVALTAALLFATLARRFGGRAGYVALLSVLSVQGVVVAGTTIQPDPLALLAFASGFVAFVTYLEAPTRAGLVTWVAATALAGLVKPTTLELGLAQVVLVLLARREALRRPALWLGWAAVLLIVGEHLLHARGLYLRYGNTFGVLSGGDSKLPTLHALLAPGTWLDLLRYAVLWGVGPAAVPAALFLAWRRRLGAEEIALGVGAACLSVLALRYTSGPFGTHYHLPHVVLGAWLVARAVNELERRGAADGARSSRVSAAVLAVAALGAVVLQARAVRFLRAQPPERETVVGHMLARVTTPGALVVVRARAPRHEAEWHTVNNFEDPRVFYLAHARGWVLGNDEPGAAPLAALAARGARFYAHVRQMAPDAELAAWLEAHAVRVAQAPEGEIYELRAGGAGGAGGDASSRTK